MTPNAALDLDLDLVRRVEAHAVRAWPPSVCERGEHGWVMRATPGLRRGRSNHALTPCRALSSDEITHGVASARAFAGRHGIVPGIQLSPLELHGEALAELSRNGWQPGAPVHVLGAPAADVAASGPGLALSVETRASQAWLSAWARCDADPDVPTHADTVFAELAGRARFVRHGEEAVGIAVESDGLVGLFCLAVAPERRRCGVGSALVRGMLASCADDAFCYLQVEGNNAAGLALYDRLGFQLVYRYVHCVEPIVASGRGRCGLPRPAEELR